MALIVGAALLIGGVIMFILLPVIQGRRASLERSVDELTESEAKKRVSLLALRDVEYDFATGKLDEKDYKELKGEISREALMALRAVEAESDDRSRGVMRPAAEVAGGIEADIAAVREGLRTGRTCHTCGHVNAEGSHFCADCGARLPAAAGTPPG
ncbi:MAG: c-type cytochrome biogenesis protein CcmI [Longimicrobiales bacterium]